MLCSQIFVAESLNLQLDRLVLFWTGDAHRKLLDVLVDTFHA